MTTKLTITSDPTSNGEVVIHVTGICSAIPSRPAKSDRWPYGPEGIRLYPGDSVELGIDANSIVAVREVWPSTAPRSHTKLDGEAVPKPGDNP